MVVGRCGCGKSVVDGWEYGAANCVYNHGVLAVAYVLQTYQRYEDGRSGEGEEEDVVDGCEWHWYV